MVFFFTLHLSMIFIAMMFFTSWMNMKNMNSLEMNLDMDLMFNSISLKISHSIQLMIFMIMISLVTSIVSYYSESYLNPYNTWKFMVNLLIFMLAMLLIITSDTFFLLMIGWDLLGLSSVFLIMFYSNKLSTMNAILTMIYNRTGDCLLVLSLVMILENNNEFFYLYPTTMFLMKLLFICASTKSAQFPLGSWLPAAMSAPTPISAMVHSSTLVTAGIYLYLKYDFFLIKNEIFLLALTTMILGSILANLDLDFKKIVAFSTMSQISMIVFFIFKFSFLVSFLHMLAHALFKSFLFVQSGLNFSKYLGTQYKMKMISKKMKTMNSLMMFISVFSMTGLIFSSSFYSKDLSMESSNSNFQSWLTFLFLLSSVLSMAYCVKLLNVSKKSFDMEMSMESMNMNKSYFLLFCLICLSVNKLMEFFFYLDLAPLINEFDCLIMLIMISLPMFLKDKNLPSNYSKSMYFSGNLLDLLMEFLIKPINKLGLSDSILKFNYIFLMKPKYFTQKNVSMYSFMMIMAVLMI